MKGVLVVEYEWTTDGDESPIAQSADRLADLIRREGNTPLGLVRSLHVAIGDVAERTLAEFSAT